MRWALFLMAALFASDAAADGFRALAGHGGPIHDVAISQDGRLALTASFDNSVGVWDLDNDSVRWLDGHEAAVKAVSFAGPGRVASAGDDFEIAIWDIDSGTRLHRLSGHAGQIKDLALSPDQTRLASASWDGTVGLWDIETGARIAQLRGHEGAVNDVVFLDAATLITASADGTIRTWNMDGSQRRILVRHGFGVTCLLVNARAGWLIYGATDGGTRVIDLATDAVLADLTLDRRPVLDIAATPDFSQVAVGDGEGHIMVVNTANWDIVHDFRAALRGPVWALAYTADGQSLLTGGIDDQAYFWPVGAKDEGPLLANAERGFLKAPETMTNGERQFRRKCSICHSLTHDGIRRAGPSLAGLFGRRAGSYPGYAYSDSVAGAGITWNAATIDALFDQGPEHYMPGTKMPMQRITKPRDRADLIAFLREHTKG
ncbi:MAG: c-type cytochrome [Rhodobacter sp.]|nr:c-type cytochrome [Rhodobacter sp.]